MDLIGTQGTVSTPIHADKPGEVLLRCAGGTETYIAYADQEIPKGTLVVVFESRGGLAVEVSPVGPIPK